jgi:hypothetical protein
MTVLSFSEIDFFMKDSARSVKRDSLIILEISMISSSRKRGYFKKLLSIDEREPN